MRVLILFMLMCGMATAGEDYIQPRQVPEWARQMTPEQRRQESLNYANQQLQNSMAAREQQQSKQQSWKEKLDQAEREAYRVQEERQSRLREANARATEEMIAEMQRQQQEKARALEEEIRRRAEDEEEFKRLKEKQNAERQSLQERIAAAEQTQQYAEAQIIAERMAHDAQQRLADKAKAEKLAWGEIPKQQMDFVQEMSTSLTLYKDAESDGEREHIWRETAKKYVQIFNDFTVSDWIGKVSVSEPALADGNSDFYTIDILASTGPFVTFSAGALTSYLDKYKTMIPENSPLYSVVSGLKKGDMVVFSGTLMPEEFDFDKEFERFVGNNNSGFIYMPFFSIHLTSIKKYTRSEKQVARLPASDRPPIRISLSDLYNPMYMGPMPNDGDRIRVRGFMEPIRFSFSGNGDSYIDFFLRSPSGAVEMRLQFDSDSDYGRAVIKIPDAHRGALLKGEALLVDVDATIRAGEEGNGIFFQDCRLVGISTQRVQW